MLRSSPREGTRAQTEPLAALLAVSILAVALSMYGGTVVDMVSSSTSDREVGDQTLERVWEDLETNGAYNVSSQPLNKTIEKESIPTGFNILVQVETVTSNGSKEAIKEARYAADGDSTVEGPPDSATTTERPISIRYAPGNVTTGRLRVSSWEP